MNGKITERDKKAKDEQIERWSRTIMVIQRPIKYTH